VNRWFSGDTNFSSNRSVPPATAPVPKSVKNPVACFAFMKENLTHLFVSIATTTSTAFLLILATASAALGLLPLPVEYRVDPFTFARWVFNHDNGFAAFKPPPNYSYRGPLGGLRVTPPGKRFAEGVIQAWAPSASRDIAADTREALIARGLSAN
jgi:hypothetical protein